MYQIKAKNTDVFVFTYLGYINEEHVVGKLNTISVALEVDKATLDEVVVVVNGTKKRSYASSSVTHLSISQINKNKKQAYHNKLANHIQYNTVTSALQGKLAGVQINNNSASNGHIVIRGTATISNNNIPLVVVDGKIMPYNPIESINPKQVNDITVLKDNNATAIYGSRGSNGVIIISTKNKEAVLTEPLYIVDGMPIKKEYNHIIEN